MMARGILLFVTASFCAATSLTALKAPSLWTWKLAILVGEFGYWLWPLPVALSLTAVALAPAGSWWRYAVWILNLVALALLLKPSVQAAQLAQALPDQLRSEFGPANVAAPPFSVRRLFLSDSETGEVKRETRRFTPQNAAVPLSLDFYYATGNHPAPCVLVIHGGGWDSGDRHQFETFNAHLARRGFAVAAMDYRLAPQFRWPAQREDALAALDYVRQHSGELGIDPTRIVLFGRSAGGQIAEAIAYENPGNVVRGVISFYAPADLYFAWHYTKENDLLNSFLLMRQYLGGSPEEVPAAFNQASAYLRVNPRSVPTLLAHGNLDALVWHRQSERLHARLKENHVPVVFLDLPWATHACDFNARGPSGQLTAFSVEWFLRAVTE